MMTKRPDVWKLRTGTGILVGGCYVIFIDWTNSNYRSGKVLRIRGDLPEQFTGWIDSIGIWRSELGCFVPVSLGELVSVESVNNRLPIQV
jgi:hypothetical protein